MILDRFKNDGLIVDWPDYVADAPGGWPQASDNQSPHRRRPGEMLWASLSQGS